jgi:hypothetical protein
MLLLWRGSGQMRPLCRRGKGVPKGDLHRKTENNGGENARRMNTPLSEQPLVKGEAEQFTPICIALLAYCFISALCCIACSARREWRVLRVLTHPAGQGFVETS